MNPKIKNLISKLGKLNEKRTPGPWGRGNFFDLAVMQTDPESDGYAICFCYPYGVPDLPDSSYKKWEKDCDYIVAACNAIPELINEIERLQALIPEWISIKDKVPEHQQYILAITPKDLGCEILTGLYDENFKQIAVFEPIGVCLDFDYWMPAPETLKGEKR